MNFETWLAFLSEGTEVPGATMAAFSRFVAIRLEKFCNVHCFKFKGLIIMIYLVFIGISM